MALEFGIFWVKKKSILFLQQIEGFISLFTVHLHSRVNQSAGNFYIQY